MIRRLLLLASLPIIGLFSLFISPSLAHAQCNATDTKGALQCGTDSGAGVPVGTDPGTTISDTIATLLTILSWIVGALAVIMIIIGGFRYVTSGGKQESVSSAKTTIIYAVVGLVIVALAQIIVHFVLNNVNNPTPSSSTTSTPSTNTLSPGAVQN